jgi:hypothetical protein
LSIILNHILNAFLNQQGRQSMASVFRNGPERHDVKQFGMTRSIGIATPIIAAAAIMSMWIVIGQ